jgi:hypothetical protein
LFPDWVCLLLSPQHLWSETTLLCRHNAAGWEGIHVSSGLDGFMSMFADEVEAPRGTWKREQQPFCCPTDAQAEVLVHRRVPLRDVLGIVVESEDQAGTTCAILEQLKAPVGDLPLFVCPDFYLPRQLSADLRAGRRPVEEAWHPQSDAHGEVDRG